MTGAGEGGTMPEPRVAADAEREMKAQLKRMEMLRQGHRRIEVRYWTGHWWEPLTGASLDACLDALVDTDRE